MVALDMDAGSIWYGKNGTWIESSNPSTNTNPATTGITGTFEAGVVMRYLNSAVTFNFGASSFSHTVPTGFNAGLFSD